MSQNVEARAISKLTMGRRKGVDSLDTKENIRRISIPRRETVGAMKPLTWTAFALAARAATVRWIQRNQERVSNRQFGLRRAEVSKAYAGPAHGMRGEGANDDGGDVDKAKAAKRPPRD